MATATNSTEGQILLSGDLTGTGESPQLRPTGATPGTYGSSFGAVAPDGTMPVTVPALVVDSKGRVNFIKSRTSTETLTPATSSTLGVVKIDGTTITSSGGTITATNISGLPTATTSVMGIARGDDATFYNDAAGGRVGIITAGPTRLGKVMPDGTTMQMSGQLLTTIVTPATTSVEGSVRPDNTTITINAGVLSRNAPVATTSVEGSVRPDNTTITVDGAGTISATVPTATSAILGISKPDNTTVTIDGAGVLSVSLPVATNIAKGAVKPDNTTVTIDGSAVLSATLPTATSSNLGISRTDNSTITISSGILTVSTPAVATSSTLGTARPDNSTITINGAGVLSIPAPSTATSSVLGIVRYTTTRITGSSGILTAGGTDGYLIRPDNSTININGSNTLSASSDIAGSGVNSFSGTQFYSREFMSMRSEYTYNIGKFESSFVINGNNIELTPETSSSSINGFDESGGDMAGVQSTYILNNGSLPISLNVTKFKIEGGSLLSFSGSDRLFFDMVLIKKSGSTIGLIYNQQILA